MKPAMDRLSQQQQQQPMSDRTPSGVRLTPGSLKEEELNDISPAFRILLKKQVELPSPAQWRDFSKVMAAKLDQEAERKSNYRSVQVIRDKFLATDSLAIRALGYGLLAVALAVIAALIWMAALMIMPDPTPATAHVPAPAVHSIASASTEKPAEFVG